MLPTVAMRTPRSAARRRSTATWIFGIREIQVDFDVGEAGQLLCRQERLLRILRNLVEIRAEDVRRDGEPAGALTAAEGVARLIDGL